MPNVSVMSISEAELVEGNVDRAGRIRVGQSPFDSGTPDIEVEFYWNSCDAGYSTPRHRHTFDQNRYELAGKRMIAVREENHGQQASGQKSVETLAASLSYYCGCNR